MDTPAPRGRPRSTVERVSKSWTIRKDLADRVQEEADSRLVGPALIVEKALETFLDTLTPPPAEFQPGRSATTPETT